MPDIFRFKQFAVDQTDCPMKINTDGVLLGALAETDQAENILDIGTGTGVIALMLTQRFNNAQIDAVEIDDTAAQTAERNFENSPFSERLSMYPVGFEQFFDENPTRKYDLIISNPPFFINSLKSPNANKELAKHTDEGFFERLIRCISSHLNTNGCCWMIVPLDTAEVIGSLANDRGLHLQKTINVHSFSYSVPHRVIICLGYKKVSTEISSLTIYKAMGDYSEEYKKLLHPYFINL